MRIRVVCNSMFQKFFTNTITNKFIKNLLSNTFLPTLKTVRDGDLIIKGCNYIYRNSIIKCIETGILFGHDSQYLESLEDLFIDDELIVETGVSPGEYDVVDTYIFGENYKGLTYKYQSKYDFYDSDTHYQLGQYLRCLRDLTGVDLMPFYNCFNYKVVDGFYIDKQSASGYIEKRSNNFDVYAIPIKFNQKYTVAFSCKFNALLKSVLYDNTGLIRANYEYINTVLTDLLNEKVFSITNSDFNQPFTYQINTDDKYLLSFEKNLYLIIQLPKNTETSIVVIEGDYANNKLNKIFSASQLKYTVPADVNNLLTKNISLLQFNDGNIYAFSDKLIEYLLLNVINKNDAITRNTQLSQKYIRAQLQIANDSHIDEYDTHIYDGEWNNYLRSVVYRMYCNNKNKVQFNVFDIDGYVDKRVEEFITKGFDV